jgi:glycosyltransferase involved in cell wall biosynthesis
MLSSRVTKARARFAAAVSRRRPPAPSAPGQAALLELARNGSAPLTSRPPASEGPWRIAVVIPSFRRGSGGHQTIARLVGGLRQRGHSLSLWLDDNEGRHAGEREAETERRFREFFAADDIELHVGRRSWTGADIVLATGWSTVAPVLLLPDAGTRAYLVQDHEPEFYGTSAESLWAQASYRQGLHCIAASSWLAELLAERYGASASHFELAVDHEVYRPAHRPRREDLVAFYARSVTPRRAVPLGLLALTELARRRPDLEIALYGDVDDPGPPFTHRSLGVLDEQHLAELYAQATVGMVLSLTNPSLIALEMMACGLPCVELASESMLASFGRHGPLALAAADPLSICDALEQLLDQPERRSAVARAGGELIAGRTWARAAAQVEDGLRIALSSASR